MRILTACGVVLLAAFLLGGCAGRPAPVGPLLDEPALDAEGVVRHWERKLELADGERVEELTLDGPILLAKTSANRLFVIDAETSAMISCIELGRPGERTFGISRHLNRLYIVGIDGLREYGLDDGLLRRKKQLPFAVSTQVVCLADDLYACSADGRLHAMLNSNLASYWTFPSGTAVTCGPVLARGLVIVGLANGKILAIRSRTNRPVWSQMVNGRIACEPISESGKLFVACEDTKLYCFGAAGERLWQQFLEGSLSQSPVPIARNGLVYQYSPATGMNALQFEQQGEPAWKTPRRDLLQFVATTVLRTYFLNDQGVLEAVEPSTGQRIAVLPTPKGAMFAINRQDSSMFLATPGGLMACLRDRNGITIDRKKLFTELEP